MMARIGVGGSVGWVPAVNTSMTRMRPPQHGHGVGKTRG